jgi:hypothetical protein
LKEGIAQDLDKKRRERWCDGGGEDATLSGGVPPKIREGSVPSQLRNSWQQEIGSTRIYIK